MGPILALTFGTLVQDTPLLKLGLRNEIASLGIATLIGFLIIRCALGGCSGGGGARAGARARRRQ
jgi:hypothetical protein